MIEDDIKYIHLDLDDWASVTRLFGLIDHRSNPGCVIVISPKGRDEERVLTEFQFLAEQSIPYALKHGKKQAEILCLQEAICHVRPDKYELVFVPASKPEKRATLTPALIERLLASAALIPRNDVLRATLSAGAANSFKDIEFIEETDWCGCGAPVNKRGQTCRDCQRAVQRRHHFHQRKWRK